MTSNSGHWTIPSTVLILEYSENGWKIGYSSSYSKIPLDYTPQNPFSISFKITGQNTNYTNAIFINNNYYVNFRYNTNIAIFGTSNTDYSYNEYVGKTITINVYANKIEVYVEGDKIGEVPISDSTMEIQVESGTHSGRYIQLKNFKVKSL